MEFITRELVEMLEERLGPFGRPFTTLTVVAGFSGVISWGGHTFVTNVGQPFFTWVLKLMGGNHDPYVIAGEALGILLVGAVTYKAVIYSFNRRARAVQKDFDVQWRLLVGHVERHNREGDTEGLLVDAWHTHKYETVADLADPEKQGNDNV